MVDDCELIHAHPHARLTLTIVGYGFEAEWHIIINSLLMQRRFTSPPVPTNPTPPTEPEDRWVAQLINDGPDLRAREICLPYVAAHPNQLVYLETPQRFNDWGHTLRILGLERATTEFWATTNADNYLMPSYVDLLLAGFDAPLITPFGAQPADLVLTPMVHNYANVNNRQDPPYSVLEVEPRRNRCDAGSLAVRTSLAKDVGWRSLASAADGDFIEDLMRHRPTPKVVTLPNVLAVHN